LGSKIRGKSDQFPIGVEIEEGYFIGTPTSDFTIVLARQIVDVMDDKDQEMLAGIWPRTENGVWRQNVVVCAHAGMHNLINYDEILFRLSDDETFSIVRVLIMYTTFFNLLEVFVN
jgi:hypothetical protein